MKDFLNVVQILTIILWIILIFKHNKKVKVNEHKLLDNIKVNNDKFIQNFKAINENRLSIHELYSSTIENTLSIHELYSSSIKHREVQVELNQEIANLLLEIIVDLEKLENRVERQGKTTQSVHNKNITLKAKIKEIEDYLEFKQMIAEILENKEDFSKDLLDDLKSDLDENKKPKRKYTKKPKKDDNKENL